MWLIVIMQKAVGYVPHGLCFPIYILTMCAQGPNPDVKKHCYETFVQAGLALSTPARNLKYSLYKRSSNGGPIAGGVIGGILGILLVTALVIYGWRKIQTFKQKPSLTPLDDLGTAAGTESRIEQSSTEAIRHGVDKHQTISVMPSTSILRYVRLISLFITLAHASSHVISPAPDHILVHLRSA